MNYKTNEQGDVAVRDSKGNLKYISKKLAMDSQLMKAMHFEVVEAPIAFEVEGKASDCDNENKGGIVSASLIDENGNKTEIDLSIPPTTETSIVVERKLEIPLTETKVAEVSPAKSTSKKTK